MGTQNISFVLTKNYQVSASTENVQWEWGLAHFLVIENNRGPRVNPPAAGSKGAGLGLAPCVWRFLGFITKIMYFKASFS